MGVSVFYGAVPCVTSNPTVSVSPSNPSGQAGNPISYTVSVTNNDSSGCTASDFLLSTTLPGGWTTTLPSSLNVAPGASVSTGMTKTAPGGTSPATYPVDAKAARGSNNGTGNANATIVVPPAVSVSVASSTYAPRAVVPMTATVLSSGNPAAGASVKFTLTKPDGKTATKTVTANASGVATWNYRLGPKDPIGSYQVSAVATYNGLSGTSNTATFTVQ
jgi:hypothetical protein